MNESPMNFQRDLPLRLLPVFATWERDYINLQKPIASVFWQRRYNDALILISFVEKYLRCKKEYHYIEGAISRCFHLLKKAFPKMPSWLINADNIWVMTKRAWWSILLTVKALTTPNMNITDDVHDILASEDMYYRFTWWFWVPYVSRRSTRTTIWLQHVTYKSL